MEASQQSFEEAVRLIFVPSGLVTSAQRQAAEATLLRVKDDPNAVSLLFRIIESSTLVEAAMQAATLLQAVLLQRYPSLSREEKDGIKQHCMHIVLVRERAALHQRSGSHDVVTGQLLTVVAILFKRGWLALTAQERAEGVRVVPQLLQTNDTAIAGLHLLGAFLGVFANTRGSSIGTSMLEYVELRKSFEGEALLQLGQALVAFLTRLTSQPQPQQKAFALSIQYLADILNWEFLDHSATSIDQGMTGAFPAQWFPLFFEPAAPSSERTLVDILFDMVESGRAGDHRDVLGQCLVRVIYPPKSMLHQAGIKVKHGVTICTRLTRVMQHLLQQPAYLSPDTPFVGLPSLSEALFKALDAIEFEASASLTNEQREFLETLSHFTISLIQLGLADEDEAAYKDALDHALMFWVRLYSRLQFCADPPATLIALLTEAARHISDRYIKERLLHCQQTAAEREDEYGVDLDLDQNDRELFADHLMSIGTIARLDMAFPLQTLLKEYNHAIERYTALGNQPASGSEQLQELFNQLHWLQLFLGHLLADAPDGESPELPSPIKRDAHLVEGVRLFWQLWLRHGQTMNAFAVDATKRDFVSPVVAETWVWLAGHFGSTYFGVTAEDAEAAPWLVSAFALQSETFPAQFQTSLMTLLGMAWHQSAEVDVLNTALDSLHQFVHSARVKPCLLHCRAFGDYAGHVLTKQLSQYPESIQPRFIRLFTSLASSAMLNEDVEEERHRWFNMVAASVGQRLELAFSAQRSSSVVSNEIHLGLSMLNAMLQATDLSIQSWALPTVLSWWQGLATVVTATSGDNDIARASLKIALTGFVAFDFSSVASPTFLTTLLESVVHLLTAIDRARQTSAHEEEEEETGMDDEGLHGRREEEEEGSELDAGAAYLTNKAKVALLSLRLGRACLKAVTGVDLSEESKRLVWQMVEHIIMKTCQPVDEIVFPNEVDRTSHHVLLAFLSMTTTLSQQTTFCSQLVACPDLALLDTMTAAFGHALRAPSVETGIKGLVSLNQCLACFIRPEQMQAWQSRLGQLVDPVLQLLLLSSTAHHSGLTSPGLQVLLGYFRLFGADFSNGLAHFIRLHLRDPTTTVVEGTVTNMYQSAQRICEAWQSRQIAPPVRFSLPMQLRQQWEGEVTQSLYTLRSLLRIV